MSFILLVDGIYVESENQLLKETNQFLESFITRTDFFIDI